MRHRTLYWFAAIGIVLIVVSDAVAWPRRHHRHCNFPRSRQLPVVAELEAKPTQERSSDRLVGTWTVVSSEQSGVADKRTIGSQWVFTRDRVVIEDQEFSYHLDTSKKAAEIDMKNLTNPNIPPGAWIGIYAVDKDVLRICVVPVTVEEPEMDWPRPTTFQTKDNDWRVLWIMKRTTTNN